LPCENGMATRGEGLGRNPSTNGAGKLDEAIVPKKVPKGGQPNEEQEGRAEAKGNTRNSTTFRAQNRVDGKTGLERVRKSALKERWLPRTKVVHLRPLERFYAKTQGGSPVR
jgi:hypothetical protein